MNETLTRSLVERIRALSKPLAPQPTGSPPRLARLPGIRAILFDVYGTMLLSASGGVGDSGTMDRTAALRDSLEAAGFSGRLDKAAEAGKDLLERHILQRHDQSRRAGVEFPEIAIHRIWELVIGDLVNAGLLAGTGSPDQVWRLVVEYECRVNPVWPAPGLHQTLRELRRNKVVLGIVSNAQFYTPLLFQALLDAGPAELGFPPELCVWSYQQGEAKPSVRLIRKALDQLEAGHGVKPFETLLVGNDMLNDVFMATYAGCKTALFAGDARSLRRRESDPRCAALVPDLTIVELTQLIEAVGVPE